MNPSLTPQAVSAALKCAMSALIASWPVYFTGPTQIGRNSGWRPIEMPDSGSA